jgi:hypothetical protein
MQRWRPWLTYGIVLALLLVALFAWNILRAGYAG